jgi:hypothetical protein
MKRRACEGVFSEHEVRLKVVDPDADEVLCPDCGSAQMEPYPFAPVEELVEKEES